MTDEATREILVATARGQLTLRAGVIDDDAEYAYTNGQCIALSLALHQLTDWLANYRPVITSGRSRLGRSHAWTPHQ